MSARSYDARHRAYDARHRSSKSATTRPRRLIAGLALPTATAAALTFATTGAAMATSNHAVTGHKNPTATSGVSSTSVALDNPRNQAKAANAVAREHAAFSAARSSERQDIAARNLAATRIEIAHGWQLPMKTCAKTSSFGWRWGRLHAVEAFASAVGTNLVAISSGTVPFAGPEDGYGTLVNIRHWDGPHTFSGHTSPASVPSAERPAPVWPEGSCPTTGASTGPHLHLEVHPEGGAAVDPLPWLAAHQIPA